MTAEVTVEVYSPRHDVPAAHSAAYATVRPAWQWRSPLPKVAGVLKELGVR